MTARRGMVRLARPPGPRAFACVRGQGFPRERRYVCVCARAGWGAGNVLLFPFLSRQLGPQVGDGGLLQDRALGVRLRERDGARDASARDRLTEISVFIKLVMPRCASTVKWCRAGRSSTCVQFSAATSSPARRWISGSQPAVLAVPRFNFKFKGSPESFDSNDQVRENIPSWLSP